MSARVKLNSILLPLLTLGSLMTQLIEPSKNWQAMVTALGGAWLISWVGDKLEEHFTLTNNGLAPAAWVEVVDRSTLHDYHRHWQS